MDGSESRTVMKISKPLENKKIKRLARLYGADIAGIGPLKPEWIYSHIGRTLGDKQGYCK